MTKRTSDQYMAMNDDDLDDELENMPVTESCDVIRRKIRALIDNGEMKVGEFQNAINVTPNAYSRFLGQNGPDKGSESSVYMAAWSFFKKRELRGIKTKPNKKAKTGTNGKDSVPSVDGIELEGEKDDKVQVYDTCDDIRHKINAHLKKPGMTQAAFLRAAAASYHAAPRKLTSPQLSAFRSKKGAYEGNTSGVFYGSYVYFEKLRIKEGKPKSKKRTEMEDIHAKDGGMETKRLMNYTLCTSDKRPVMDSYGRLGFC
ncbi:uncharacterized protein K460DRAFT_367871 [Cucurbitaria berberidis CBS 394.84]|uniref:DUF7726 domain-containing protein n=1 Tax=Cucurbitaria berberidis CBS 394.84 TaxID=1168544 RepID=A0A9P4GCW7_9PLEO|nr:uncharacterized protein K460DRAFT_367871 [Cucurbitaria berberidis CBS 394.84]KAF1842934.1 hypothetical protein K460DRAFT_367871 [Cucurbitaria berberidis CBS 394.84]